MPLPPVSFGIKLRMSGTFGDGEWGNVFHGTYAGSAPSDSDMDTLALGVKTAWVDHIASSMTDDVKLLQVTTEDLTTTSSAVGIWAGLAAGTQSTTQFITPAECVVERDHIARRYRGGHPRHYWPLSYPSWKATDTTLSPTAVADWQSAIETFYTEVFSITWPGQTGFVYANVSYYSGGALRSVPVTDPIIGITVDTKIGTQRRRVMR